VCVTGFGRGGVGWVNSNNKVCLQVSAEKMKISSYAVVGKCHPPNVPKSLD